MGIVFKPCEISDIAEIGKFRQAIWATTYRGIYKDKLIDEFDFEGYLKKDTAKLSDANYYLYMIQKDKQSIGYFSFQYKRSVHLQSLYILKTFQDLGIGSQVIVFVRQWCEAQHIQKFTCNCNAHNASAQKFYIQQGGKVIAEDLGHQDSRDDQLTYEFNVKD